MTDEQILARGGTDEDINEYAKQNGADLNMLKMKPLGKKAYGSIGHLPFSRLGSGDHSVNDGMAKICLEAIRDKHDIIIIQEKLDGSNCSVCKIDGKILALTRAGYLATSSQYEQHQLFNSWVIDNYARFDDLLFNGERVVGEWLAQAHGTRYDLRHEPFVVFDLMRDDDRLPYWSFINRVKQHGFITPKLISYGMPMKHEDILKRLDPSGHGAIDEVEGYVVRVERKGKVDFLAKYVRPTKIDGKYFNENNGDGIWNWRLEQV